MPHKSRPPRRKRASLTDLLLAYVVIVVLGVTFYVYFITSATQHLTSNRISQRTYRNVFEGRQPQNQWGHAVLYNLDQTQQRLGIRNANENIKELSEDEKNLLPVESYLGDGPRQTSCDNCFKYNVKAVIKANSCLTSWASKHIDLLVLILSAPENIDRRNALRETWLSPYINNTSKVRYLFLLGLSEYVASDAIIQQENTVYKDILQGDFLDDYHNLTYKTLMGLTWAANHCKEAKLIIKVDDDVWLNIPTLLQLLNYNLHSFSVGGKCLHNSLPIRNPDSKWYASLQSYPEAYFPPFCAGPGYVISPKTAAKILEVSKNVPYFHLEDVYVGMCIQKLGQRTKTIYGFLSFKPSGHLCRLRHYSIILIHEVSPKDMRLTWDYRCGGKTFLGRKRRRMLG
ncbi:beta-1,3-galactosyltransferase 5-like [Haliotis rubra]|uniref:beta-1,3-galactosyltransferase 5-like n=1 Tax=Haliotis rubra TaxID=36100 RepID=UPI001EE52BF1|nr:beta-1,3-galactosyltransferase 5-like [Haliotis rubra]